MRWRKATTTPSIREPEAFSAARMVVSTSSRSIAANLHACVVVRYGTVGTVGTIGTVGGGWMSGAGYEASFEVC